MEAFTPTEHREHWPAAWVVKNLGSTALQHQLQQRQMAALASPRFEQFADLEDPAVIRGSE